MLSSWGYDAVKAGWQERLGAELQRGGSAGSGASWQSPGCCIPDPSLAESRVVCPLGKSIQLGLEVLLVGLDVSRLLGDCLFLTEPKLLCNLLDESEVVADWHHATFKLIDGICCRELFATVPLKWHWFPLSAFPLVGSP